VHPAPAPEQAGAMSPAPLGLEPADPPRPGLHGAWPGSSFSVTMGMTEHLLGSMTRLFGSEHDRRACRSWLAGWGPAYIPRFTF